MSKRPMVADGVTALTAVLTQAGYRSTAEAVAAHALFLHPATVAQTEGQAISRSCVICTSGASLPRSATGRCS
jgi:hypothetical protein